ncbi:hypothetical protein EC988_007767, partial [Linderina pennispora]
MGLNSDGSTRQTQGMLHTTQTPVLSAGDGYTRSWIASWQQYAVLILPGIAMLGYVIVPALWSRLAAWLGQLRRLRS